MKTILTYETRKKNVEKHNIKSNVMSSLISHNNNNKSEVKRIVIYSTKDIDTGKTNGVTEAT